MRLRCWSGRKAIIRLFNRPHFLRTVFRAMPDSVGVHRKRPEESSAKAPAANFLVVARLMGADGHIKSLKPGTQGLRRRSFHNRP